MYRQIIDTLNQFLNYIHIPGTPLNPDAFQGILVKKLSNQNIIKDKRRINAGDTSSTVNQTHIDVTGKQGMLFFFEELNNATTSVQSRIASAPASITIFLPVAYPASLIP